MSVNFLSRFKTWWQAPATRKDKVRGVLFGSLGGFWIGVFGRLVFTSTSSPVELTTLGLWGLGVALLAGFLGYKFPKVVTCLLFPLAFVGIGNS